jgi:hypothetical protein
MLDATTADEDPMSHVRLKSTWPNSVAPVANVVIVETTAVELPADELTPLWEALPRKPDPHAGNGAVVPFATTLRRVS